MTFSTKAFGIRKALAGQPGSVIVIGGATEPEMSADLPFERVGRVVLLEPVVRRAEELRIAWSAYPQVEVIAAALATESGSADLLQFNLPGLRSFYEPTAALFDLLPGLECRSRQIVERLSPSALLERLGALPVPLHLYIDLLGSEGEILAAWPKPLPDLVTAHTVRAPTFGFEQMPPLAELALERGYDLIARDDSDVDWPWLTLQQNRLMPALEAERAARTQASAEAEKRLLRIKEIEVLRTRQHTELGKQAERIADLEGMKGELQAARDTAESNLAVAMRMTTLLQGDLQDLRERLREADRQRRVQQELLQNLLPRLQQAAQELQNLPLPSPTAVSEALATDAKESEPAIKPTRKGRGKKSRGPRS